MDTQRLYVHVYIDDNTCAAPDVAHFENAMYPWTSTDYVYIDHNTCVAPVVGHFENAMYPWTPTDYVYTHM